MAAEAEQFARDWVSLPKAEGDLYHVVSLSPRVHGAFATRDATGRPAILCAAGGDSAPAMELRGVRVEHAVPADLKDGSSTRVVEVSLIRCLLEDPSVFPLFLECLSAALPAVEAGRTRHQVNQAVDQLVKLFASLANPGAPPAGLWAELLVICRSAEPQMLLRCWHTRGRQRHDFAGERQRLEVKATQTGERRHLFGLEQLTHGGEAAVAVVSLMLEETDAGTRLGELRERCLSAAAGDEELRLKVDRLCAGYLGNAWAAGLRVAFDEEAAWSERLVVDGASVPRPVVPPAVTEVTFRSDLTGLTPLRRGEQGPLADAIIG